jgi:hypothetical protein
VTFFVWKIDLVITIGMISFFIMGTFINTLIWTYIW